MIWSSYCGLSAIAQKQPVDQVVVVSCPIVREADTDDANNVIKPLVGGRVYLTLTSFPKRCSACVGLRVDAECVRRKAGVPLHSSPFSLCAVNQPLSVRRPSTLGVSTFRKPVVVVCTSFWRVGCHDRSCFEFYGFLRCATKTGKH